MADTLFGKRSAYLNLDTSEGVATLNELLAASDVVMSGYRPGALDRFGLDEESLADVHPGVVVVYLDAWGHTGPWVERRGFDSIVQDPAA
jgi:crotonobetainyl-CoA:carnitine CoA-transferase CaiB-like acyl-CoA transferase